MTPHRASPPPAVRSASGYSLIELMAAMAITLFIMAGIYGLMIQNQRVYEQQSRLADVQQAARVAMDLMSREIRMAGADPSGRAFAPETGCIDADYRLPTDGAQPAPGDLAPVTVAQETRIRVKMDRPTWILGPEPAGTPTPTPNPPVKRDCDTSGGDFGTYRRDDEDGLGDGFVNDEGEDIEYLWTGLAPAAPERPRVLYRIEHRLDPADACRPCPTPTPQEAPSRQPIAENVVQLRFKYYQGPPPAAPCPAAGATYADEAAFEAAQDACDPPLVLDGTTGQPTDLRGIVRVRIRITIQTEKPDSLRPKTSPKFGHEWITLTSEATLRNRVF